MTKHFILNLALVTSFVISSNYAFADAPTCISGTPLSKNLIVQLEDASKKSPLTILINDQYKLGPKTEGAVDPYCPTGECGKNLLPSLPVTQVRSEVFKSHAPPKLAFNEACVHASSTFTSKTPQISCPGGEKSTSSMCVTADQLKYQNAVVSSFANCAITLGMTGIDLNSMFQKYSIESGFKPQYSSGGGVGIGQLTSIFVDDVHQSHRGLPYMKAIADSKSDECKAAGIIAKKDLNNKPSFANKCNFISVGDGFERNVLYSMIGITTVWEKNIEPKLRKYLNKNSEKEGIDDVKKLTLMNAYGSGGPGASIEVIRRFSQFSPAEFAHRMKKSYFIGKRNLTAYTSNIETRQNKIKKLLPESMRSEFNEKGAASCINPY